MKTRVTITLDPAAHQRARKTARARRTTVSGLIETLLNDASAPKKSSLVDEMIGVAKIGPKPGRGDALYDALKAKYLDT